MSNFAQTSPSHGHLLSQGNRCGAGPDLWRLVIDRCGASLGEPRLRPAGAALHLKEGSVDTTTLLIIIIIVLVLGGGGWYGRGRWY
jgi:hypothetical protein